MAIRIGRFEVTFDAIRRTPMVVRGLMARGIVVSCHLDLPRLVLVYVFICDDFREIPDDERIPWYEVVVVFKAGYCRYQFVEIVP